MLRHCSCLNAPPHEPAATSFLSGLNITTSRHDQNSRTQSTIIMKGLITLLALPATISLSNAAQVSCAREAPQDKFILSEDAQQKICAMYFDNINGIRGAPLPDKEQEAQPITNDDNEWLDPDADDHNIKNNAIRLRETSPECGYYDGLGRRISEQEYQLELDYEVEHGVPYPPHLRPEARSLSLHAHSDTQCGGDAIGEITQPDVCYPVTKGMGVSVGSLPLPRNCEVLGYVGETCDDEPVEVVPLWRSKEGGCYAPLGTAVSAAGRTFFGSVLVECEPLVD
jgi:hypothetical protein